MVTRANAPRLRKTHVLSASQLAQNWR